MSQFRFGTRRTRGQSALATPERLAEESIALYEQMDARLPLDSYTGIPVFAISTEKLRQRQKKLRRGPELVSWLTRHATETIDGGAISLVTGIAPVDKAPRFQSFEITLAKDGSWLAAHPGVSYPPEPLVPLYEETSIAWKLALLGGLKTQVELIPLPQAAREVSLT